MKRLSSEKLSRLLENKLDVRVFDKVASTNDEARNLHNGVAFALVQTSGRGRTEGRKFSSAAGGLYFSLSLEVRDGHVIIDGRKFPFTPGQVTVAAGIAVAKVLLGLGYDAKIKWVNDVFVDGKKVCGILAFLAGDKLIVGIGVNLDSEIPSELQPIAASLGFKGDFNVAAADIINGFFRELISPDMAFLRTHCLTLGKTVETNFGIGTAIDIDRDGALLVKINDEVKRIISGEAIVKK